MRVFTHQYDNCPKERNSTPPDLIKVVARFRFLQDIRARFSVEEIADQKGE
jgi:hypothetical protein